MHMQREKIYFNNILCVFLALFILSSSQLSPILKEKSSYKNEQKEQENKSDQNKTPEFHNYSVEAILPIVDFKAPELVFYTISLPDITRCYASNFYIGKILQSSIFKKLFTCIIAANAP
jgi:hypothetical protein